MGFLFLNKIFLYLSSATLGFGAACIVFSVLDFILYKFLINKLINRNYIALKISILTQKIFIFYCCK